LCQHIAQFTSPDVSISFLIEDLESSDELLYDAQVLAMQARIEKVELPGVPAGLNPSGRLRIAKNVL